MVDCDNVTSVQRHDRSRESRRPFSKCGVEQSIFGDSVSLERLPEAPHWRTKNRCRHVQKASSLAPLQTPGTDDRA